MFLKRFQNVFKPFISGHLVRFKKNLKMFLKCFPPLGYLSFLNTLDLALPL